MPRPSSALQADGLVGLLDAADRSERTSLYRALGLTLRYEREAVWWLSRLAALGTTRRDEHGQPRRVRGRAFHAHLDFAKVLYVLEGEYSFRVGSKTFGGGPGTLVYVPRGSHHTFTTRTGGRVLFVCSPSGNEEMFLELGKLGANASVAELEELSARFATVELAGEDGRPWRPT